VLLIYVFQPPLPRLTPRSTYSLDDANDPSTKYLEMLEGSFVWEARSLYIIAAGVPAWIFYNPAGLVIAGLGGLVTIVMVRSHIYLMFPPFSNLNSSAKSFLPYVSRAQNTKQTHHRQPNHIFLRAHFRTRFSLVC
jgi:hypothetical protein